MVVNVTTRDYTKPWKQNKTTQKQTTTHKVGNNERPKSKQTKPQTNKKPK